MLRFLIALFLLSGLVHAEKVSPARHAKLVEKGENIALKLCDEAKLSQIKSKQLDVVLQQIETINPCAALNQKNKEALACFLMTGHSGGHANTKGQLNVPKESKCPVCGMFVGKYPKWAALIGTASTKHYFDGVKDMMKFYIFDADFPYDRSKITHIEVTDFYTLEAIDAHESFYVLGSNIYGPMGNELIPFSSKEAAQNFMGDHKGKKIIQFSDITPKLVMGLDGVEYND